MMVFLKIPTSKWMDKLAMTYHFVVILGLEHLDRANKEVMDFNMRLSRREC